MSTPHDRGRAPGSGAPAGLSQRRRVARFSATLRTRIAHELREDVLLGHLPAGTTLGLEELAEQFGSSRTPVREALIELEHDGLVEITPRAGVRVIGIGSRELLDNFSLFAALTGVAAEWGTRRMTGERLARIRQLGERVEADAAGPHEDLVTANWLFHREINHAAQSQRLCSLLRRTCRVVPVRFFELIPDQAEITRREHRHLVDAIAAGDSRRARDLAEAHVARAGDLLAARLADGAAGNPAVAG